uniref:Uncharacterized protein n=1 Tax=Arundo donax TaxID=35708 RepID=A0A0A9BQS5_ARUDO
MLEWGRIVQSHNDNCVYGVWPHTMECLLLQFLLPCLPHRRLWHMVFQHLQISLLEMLIRLAQPFKLKLLKKR